MLTDSTIDRRREIRSNLILEFRDFVTVENTGNSLVDISVAY